MFYRVLNTPLLTDVDKKVTGMAIFLHSNFLSLKPVAYLFGTNESGLIKNDLKNII